MNYNRSNPQTLVLIFCRSIHLYLLVTSLITYYGIYEKGNFNNQPPWHCPFKITIILLLLYILVLKWYYDQKIISFFSSDFESVFA